MTDPTELLRRARERWCGEPNRLTPASGWVYAPCPPEVVAVLLAVAEQALLIGAEIAHKGELSRGTMEGIVLVNGLGEMLHDLTFAIEEALK